MFSALTTATVPKEVTIGVEPVFTAALPLNPTDRVLATTRQLVRIGDHAARVILAEPGNRDRMDFSQVKEEIKKRTGIGDAPAAIAAWAVDHLLDV